MRLIGKMPNNQKTVVACNTIINRTIQERFCRNEGFCTHANAKPVTSYNFVMSCKISSSFSFVLLLMMMVKEWLCCGNFGDLLDLVVIAVEVQMDFVVLTLTLTNECRK